MNHKLAATIVLLLGLIALAGAGGCNQLWRPPVDLASARISGEPTDADWAKAATVSVPPGVKAQFLWNDQGLYCHVAGNDLSSAEFDEYLLLSLEAVEEKLSLLPISEVKFHLPAGVLPMEHGGHAWPPLTAVGTNGPLDTALYKFEVGSIITKRGFPWWEHLFVSWEALTPDKGPPEKLSVHLYRVKGERPYALLTLDRGK